MQRNVLLMDDESYHDIAEFDYKVITYNIVYEQII